MSKKTRQNKKKSH